MKEFLPRLIILLFLILLMVFILENFSSNEAPPIIVNGQSVNEMLKTCVQDNSLPINYRDMINESNVLYCLCDQGVQISYDGRDICETSP